MRILSFFITCQLYNQFDCPFNWKTKRFFIIANPENHNGAREWSHRLQVALHTTDSVARVASIPAYLSPLLTRPIVKKRIYDLEPENEVFLDWYEEFSQMNNISTYPTLLHIENNKIISRAAGPYTHEKLHRFLKRNVVDGGETCTRLLNNQINF